MKNFFVRLAALPLLVQLALTSPRAETPADAAAKPYNPLPAKVAGWSLLAVGLGMAAYGAFPLDDGGCGLLEIGCDDDSRQRQWMLMGGGALIGSFGALLVWGAEKEAGQATPRAVVDQPSEGSSPKNPWIGMGLGVAGAAVGTYLMWNDPSVPQGLIGVVTPAAGQLYAGTIPGIAGGLLLRAGGGLLTARNTLDCRDGESCDKNNVLGRGLYLLGVAVSLSDTWATIQRSGRPRPEATSKVSLSPTLLPLGNGRLAPGLAYTARW